MANQHDETQAIPGGTQPAWAAKPLPHQDAVPHRDAVPPASLIGPRETTVEPKRRDIFKIIRNVGIVCSAAAGGLKLADSLGAFGSGHRTPAAVVDGATQPDALATPGLYDALPARHVIGGGFEANDIFDRPVCSADGVFICSGKGTVTALNLDGGKRWEKQLKAVVHTPVLDPSGEYLYVATEDGVQALGQKDGAPGRHYLFPAGLSNTGPYHAPGIDGKDIVALAVNDEADYVVVRFDIASGTPHPGTVLNLPDKLAFAAADLVWGPGALFSWGSNEFFRIDTQTGAVQSTTRLAVGGFPRLAQAGDVLYAVDGKMAAYDAKDLSRLWWKFAPPGDTGNAETATFSADFAVGDSSVYAVSWLDTLYALTRGTNLASKPLAKVANSYDQLAVANRQIYAGLNDGTGLVSLDAATGKAQWFCKIGDQPGQMIHPPVANANVVALSVDVKQDAQYQHWLYLVGIAAS